MTRLKTLPRGESSAWRGRLLLALAFFVSVTLSMAGCKRSDNTGNTSGNTSGLNQTNTTNDNNATAEAIKGMADQQGQATMPDRGNFSVQYSNVQNP